MRFSILVVVVVLAILGLVWAADTQPTKMIHMIVQMDGTGIPKDSFAAKPKIMWRASTQYCRVDEQPDPERGIHGRMIVNEPDAWMVNLVDNTARHMVDPGPTFNCRLPVFAFDPAALKTKLGELEFGHEIDFFRNNGAQLVDGPKMSFEAKYYRLKLDDSLLLLIERVDIHVPLRVAWSQGEKAYTVTYSLWDDQVPFKSEIFAKPVGMKIEEPK